MLGDVHGDILVAGSVGLLGEGVSVVRKKIMVSQMCLYDYDVWV